ncbi:hypothetical protein A4D02_20665 [Niastella koreensis]|nr:hypothetical protein A4D02_20665 [Niastella koreensis]
MGGGVSYMQKRPKMIQTVLKVKGQIRQSGKWIKWSVLGHLLIESHVNWGWSASVKKVKSVNGPYSQFLNDSPDLSVFRLKSPVLTGLYNNIIKLTFSQQAL